MLPHAAHPQRDEKDQLAVSVRGDVVTSLLPVVDNFELARTQVKAETEAEQKINNSYQVGMTSKSF
jgi:molecular chaperone GrpE